MAFDAAMHKPRRVGTLHVLNTDNSARVSLPLYNGYNLIGSMGESASLDSSQTIDIAPYDADRAGLSEEDLCNSSYVNLPYRRYTPCHAYIEFNGGTVFLVDFGFKEGTFIDAMADFVTPFCKHVLRPIELVRFGPISCLIQSLTDGRETLHKMQSQQATNILKGILEAQASRTLGHTSGGSSRASATPVQLPQSGSHVLAPDSLPSSSPTESDTGTAIMPSAPKDREIPLESACLPADDAQTAQATLPSGSPRRLIAPKLGQKPTRAAKTLVKPSTGSRHSGLISQSQSFVVMNLSQETVAYLDGGTTIPLPSTPEQSQQQSPIVVFDSQSSMGSTATEILCIGQGPTQRLSPQLSTVGAHFDDSPTQPDQLSLASTLTLPGDDDRDGASDGTAEWIKPAALSNDSSAGVAVPVPCPARQHALPRHDGQHARRAPALLTSNLPRLTPNLVQRVAKAPKPTEQPGSKPSPVPLPKPTPEEKETLTRNKPPSGSGTGTRQFASDPSRTHKSSHTEVQSRETATQQITLMEHSLIYDYCDIGAKQDRILEWQNAIETTDWSDAESGNSTGHIAGQDASATTDYDTTAGTMTNNTTLSIADADWKESSNVHMDNTKLPFKVLLPGRHETAQMAFLRRQKKIVHKKGERLLHGEQTWQTEEEEAAAMATIDSYLSMVGAQYLMLERANTGLTTASARSERSRRLFGGEDHRRQTLQAIERSRSSSSRYRPVVANNIVVGSTQPQSGDANRTRRGQPTPRVSPTASGDEPPSSRAYGDGGAMPNDRESPHADYHAEDDQPVYGRFSEESDIDSAADDNDVPPVLSGKERARNLPRVSSAQLASANTKSLTQAPEKGKERRGTRAGTQNTPSQALRTKSATQLGKSQARSTQGRTSSMQQRKSGVRYHYSTTTPPVRAVRENAALRNVRRSARKTNSAYASSLHAAKSHACASQQPSLNSAGNPAGGTTAPFVHDAAAVSGLADDNQYGIANTEWDPMDVEARVPTPLAMPPSKQTSTPAAPVAARPALQPREPPQQCPSRAALGTVSLNQQHFGNIVIGFADYEDSETTKYRDIIDQLSGEGTENWLQCTHLVCKRISLKEKFVGAVVRGVHIVTADWLLASQREQQFVGEAPFVLQDSKGEKLYGFSLQKRLEQSTEPQRRKEMNRLTVYLSKKIDIVRVQVKRLITAAGGHLALYSEDAERSKIHGECIALCAPGETREHSARAAEKCIVMDPQELAIRLLKNTLGECRRGKIYLSSALPAKASPA
ncbi:hypothetical protein THASP1DRAFT_29511 [Thamnocephalis sphaerospora]|uniref:Uncharacterized protein n=1 Tax=Thamnocephalis sphaerospora TaxID=78915 RepID=A0A4P9XTD8_9FUNG|nr:hypothetical protein THASP1DRAFT_29511 [Thamnocephalis sphaerospora]|eukprot:RKP08700.1 hypothetical protein THASP1DRAFT_29511 [Thamnocephalis sphaerospora]